MYCGAFRARFRPYFLRSFMRGSRVSRPAWRSGARALVSAHPDARRSLREAGLLTRDPRAKERKKYGLKRARKAPQYTKR